MNKIKKHFYNFKESQINTIKLKEIDSSRKVNLALEDICKQKWHNKIEELNKIGTELWDSDIYRFEKIEINSDELIIQVSTIPFSVRLILNDHTDELDKLGQTYFPLGMFFSCFVVTSDDYFVFIKKSDKLYFDRQFSFVGGILSKTEVGNTSQCDIFDEVKREVREELGIGSSMVKIIKLLSCYETENFNFCLLFKVNLDITYNELLQIFSNQSDEIDVEVSAIFGIEKKKLQKFISNNFPPKDIYKFSFL